MNHTSLGRFSDKNISSNTMLNIHHPVTDNHKGSLRTFKVYVVGTGFIPVRLWNDYPAKAVTWKKFPLPLGERVRVRG
ncbi:MAG: hypothetical protein AB1797_03600 [bacterium]